MNQVKIWNLLLNIFILLILVRRSSGWNRQAYEFSRQLYEHAQEQWRYQLELERKDHEEYQEAVTQHNDKLLNDIEDGNKKIQEGDEDFHETFEANREKGTPGAVFAKRTQSGQSKYI
jgi:argininosuccinate lyase